MGEKKTGRPRTDEATEIDKMIGLRLFSARQAKGWSQDYLAKSVNLTFQQIQKYEKGVNRISASRLVEFAQVMELSVMFFLEGQEKPAKEEEQQDTVSVALRRARTRFTTLVFAIEDIDVLKAGTLLFERLS